MSKYSDTTAHTQHLALIKSKLPEWSTIAQPHIKFQRLSGLTNINYRVKDIQGNRAPLIFKQFSQVEGLLGRQYENKILIQASQKGIGPKCYYADEEYRIEQEIANFKHPSNVELQEVGLVGKIMEKLAQFHQITLEEIKNKPIFCDYILSKEFINKAMKRINSRKFTTEEQKVVDRITAYFSEDKLESLRKTLLPKSSNKMVRLCHNDLNNLNIMVTEEDIYLIDFQYARYNYVAYDIANFLSQSSIDYSKQEEPFFEFLDDLMPTRKQVEWVCEKYLSSSNEKGTVTEEMVEEMADDVERCFGLCNFYWAVWSPMTKNPKISFDYMEHGVRRLERFEGVMSKYGEQE